MNQHGTHSLWENPAEWDAERYHRISAPQVAWGERVLDRVVLRGDETVLDAGCGTGRLTAKLIERLPGGCVLAVDKSQNMLRAASEHLSLRFGSRVRFVRADLAWLPCERAADGIFSTAAFHWVTDHPRLFHSLFESLKPGGWLIAQCGGAGNLMRFHRRVLGLTASAPYDRYFAGWREPKEYADDAVTAERLRAAGFTDIRTSLEPAPTSFGSAEEYVEFVASVVLRLHLSRLPDGGSRASFVHRLAEEAASDDPPFLLDYGRLNIDGRRPAAA